MAACWPAPGGNGHAAAGEQSARLRCQKVDFRREGRLRLGSVREGPREHRGGGCGERGSNVHVSQGEVAHWAEGGWSVHGW